MTTADHDLKRMDEALQLAERAWGDTNPNPLVGAILESPTGEVIGRGFHHQCGQAHAEIEAFRDAELQGFSASGATLYVTLEPCSTFGHTPPCTAKIIASGIRRVVIGAIDPNPRHAGAGVEILRQAGIEVVTGVRERECRYLNRAFFHWITTGKPYVVLKLATTLDGKIATASGNSRWITGEAARHRVQYWRKIADAILIGAATARIDRPQLTVRDFPRKRPQPVRIVASSTMSETELAEIFPDGNARVADLSTPERFAGLLTELGAQPRMLLLIEGGGELAGAALRARIVNEVEFHIAPKILGGRHSRPAVGGSDPETLAEALALNDLRYFPCGDDLIVSGLIANNETRS